VLWFLVYVRISVNILIDKLKELQVERISRW